MKKKPRPLNSLYADCRCHMEPGGRRLVSVQVEADLSKAQSRNLWRWLTVAMAWQHDDAKPKKKAKRK